MYTLYSFNKKSSYFLWFDMHGKSLTEGECKLKCRVIVAVKFPTEAIGKNKPEKNQGFNGVRTSDLRDTGAMLYQLSYEATHWEREFIFPCSEMM